MEAVRTASDVPGQNEKPRVNLKALDHAGLEAFAVERGLPAFRGRQLFNWIYARGETDFARMTDLPGALRTTLSDVAEVPAISFVLLREAADLTIKALVRLASGREVETVLIPDFDEAGGVRRVTVCVSSQVGCAMACSFCATGRMGFHQNLVAGEIYDQVWHMDRLSRERFGRGVTNVVYMGMGEPLLNYENVLRSTNLLSHPDALGLSPRRITVSTVGLARRIRQLADDETKFKLAVSLHAPSDEKRSSIMPVNRSEATDLTALRDAIRHYVHQTRRRITYEYCMFRGFNDGEQDARRLVRVSRWAPSKVNLIMYNPVPGLDFQPTPEHQLDRFIRILVDGGVRVTVRRSRGQDIAAACGQLALEQVQAS